jgi:hypothetical protein
MFKVAQLQTFVHVRSQLNLGGCPLCDKRQLPAVRVVYCAPVATHPPSVIRPARPICSALLETFVSLICVDDKMETFRTHFALLH